MGTPLATGVFMIRGNKSPHFSPNSVKSDHCSGWKYTEGRICWRCSGKTWVWFLIRTEAVFAPWSCREHCGLISLEEISQFRSGEGSREWKKRQGWKAWNTRENRPDCFSFSARNTRRVDTIPFSLPFPRNVSNFSLCKKNKWINKSISKDAVGFILAQQSEFRLQVHNLALESLQKVWRCLDLGGRGGRLQPFFFLKALHCQDLPCQNIPAVIQVRWIVQVDRIMLQILITYILIFIPQGGTASKVWG